MPCQDLYIASSFVKLSCTGTNAEVYTLGTGTCTTTSPTPAPTSTPTSVSPARWPTGLAHDFYHLPNLHPHHKPVHFSRPHT